MGRKAGARSAKIVGWRCWYQRHFPWKNKSRWHWWRTSWWTRIRVVKA